MANVWIPSLMRDLTNGQTMVTVPGDTIREVVAALEHRFPGLEDRLCEHGRIRPHIAVVVDGQVSRQGLRRSLSESSEVHFLPSISGG